jgi:hypothetical protein
MGLPNGPVRPMNMQLDWIAVRGHLSARDLIGYLLFGLTIASEIVSRKLLAFKKSPS